MPTDARVVRTRARLREALLELIGEQRLQDITVAEIAERAGVGYATFFRHYTDKTALWNEIADELTTETIERMKPFAAAGDTSRMALEFCTFVNDNRDILRKIYAQGAEGLVREELIKRSSALASDARSRRGYDLPLDLAFVHATNATLGIMVWWLDHYDEVGLEQIAGILDQLVMQPVQRMALHGTS